MGKKWITGTLLAIGILWGAAPGHAQTDTPTPITVLVTVIVVPATATPTFTPSETPLPTDTPPPTETPTPSDTPLPSDTPSPTPQQVGSISLSTGGGGSAQANIHYSLTLGEFVIVVLLFAIFTTLTIQWVLKMLRRE